MVVLAITVVFFPQFSSSISLRFSPEQDSRIFILVSITQHISETDSVEHLSDIHEDNIYWIRLSFLLSYYVISSIVSKFFSATLLFLTNWVFFLNHYFYNAGQRFHNWTKGSYYPFTVSCKLSYESSYSFSTF